MSSRPNCYGFSDFATCGCKVHPCVDWGVDGGVDCPGLTIEVSIESTPLCRLKVPPCVDWGVDRRVGSPGQTIGVSTDMSIRPD